MYKILPYVVVLAIVIYLYYVAGRMEFAAPGGRIGPDFWPKTILLMAMVTCVYEIVKSLFFAKADHEIGGVLQSIVADAPDASADEPQQTYPWRLLIGMVLTLAYAFLIEPLGFFVCTMLYLAAFMYVGRYCRHGVIIASSVIGSLVFMFVFMKIVYVSLPLGQGPFGELSILLMRLMGIK
jgi:putative tricarboxylic transport membrane protein